MLSAVVIAKNEQANIGSCLQSLAFVSHVLVVDTGSTDDTLAIAKSFPNVQTLEIPWHGFAQAKQTALQNARTDWVLTVDADETVSPALRDEICALGTQNYLGFQAFDVPRKTFFLGKWVKHAGWYPDRTLRLLHRAHGRYNEQLLHEGIHLDNGARLGHLSMDLLHDSYRSIDQFFAKMTSYGRYGAQELVRKGRRFRTADLLFRPVFKFFSLYFLKCGFLDGRAGLVVCMGNAYSTFIKYATLYYLPQSPPQKTLGKEN